MDESWPRAGALSGPFGRALTVDVEEWYHTCFVPDYIDPRRRPRLPEELDGLIPDLLEMFDRAGCQGTFFILGEVARRWPRRIREIVAAGHEVASHGDLHFRVGARDVDQFREDVRTSKRCLEDLAGEPVLGFRAPEWSFRRLANPRLRILAEEGYVYDASLHPSPFGGSLGNPRTPTRLTWQPTEEHGRAELLEFPPLTFAGPLRLPAGSWTGRLVRPSTVRKAADRTAGRGGLPVLVVHPWELTGRRTPGPLPGHIARFVHETGRLGYRSRFESLLDDGGWTTLRRAAGLDATSRSAAGGD